MPTLLVLNPNTSPEVSALLLRHAQASAPAGATAQAVTARFGARYISDEVAACIAGHAALDAWAAHVASDGLPDAVLLGCFGDPGLFALRALSPVPVLGLAEASMQAAAQLGPFVVVTGGAAWAPMLQRLANALDLGTSLAGVHTVSATGAQLAADPAAGQRLLRQAAREALSRWPTARSVLLGGAGLAGMAAAVGDGMEVAVLDSVAMALRASWSAANEPRRRTMPSVSPGAWHGLSGELNLMLTQSVTS